MMLDFIEQLKNRLKTPLPGEDAQFIMAPLGRPKAGEIDFSKLNPKKSAVLILLFPSTDRIDTVLIKRPVYEGVHSGQIAFPGGKFEKTDQTLDQTAIRETNEEIGVLADKIQLIGQLSDLYIPPSNFMVSPFIGYLHEKPNFIINSREVEKTITTDLLMLSKRPILKKNITNSSGFTIKTPYIEIDGYTVWGATAMIISELNAITQGIIV